MVNKKLKLLIGIATILAVQKSNTVYADITNSNTNVSMINNESTISNTDNNLSPEQLETTTPSSVTIETTTPSSVTKNTSEAKGELGYIGLYEDFSDNTIKIRDIRYDSNWHKSVNNTEGFYTYEGSNKYELKSILWEVFDESKGDFVKLDNTSDNISIEILKNKYVRCTIGVSVDNYIMYYSTENLFVSETKPSYNTIDETSMFVNIDDNTASIEADINPVDSNDKLRELLSKNDANLVWEVFNPITKKYEDIVKDKLSFDASNYLGHNIRAKLYSDGTCYYILYSSPQFTTKIVGDNLVLDLTPQN